jgi:GT2 family glycosyltransferase
VARRWLACQIRETGLFDPYAYAASAGLFGLSEDELIRHYLEQPAGGSVSPQPLFDAENYRAIAGPAADSFPFLHFAVLGAHRSEGLCPTFNAETYLAENPDIRIAGWQPTRHYLEHGWREGRLATVTEPPPPAIPDFSGLVGRAGRQGGAAIDVVIPVYRGHAETLIAVHSVLAARTRVPFRLLVIDDSSPEPALVRDLALLEARGHIDRIVNARNLGFTATANLGLRLGGQPDVVLLNADAEVYDDWLDRLRATAYRAADIGTVTPLSNAATILSYPVRLRDNPAPLELTYANLAKILGGLDLPPVEIPTGVGFCLYLRRDCLEAVGPFDERAFPRGYGEENDFCLRAAKLGWRHLAATDTFVRHLGSRSFKEERSGLVRHALEKLEASHPGYLATINQFMTLDPLATTRRQLDIARIRAAGHSGRLSHAAARGAHSPPDLILRRYAGMPNRFHLHSPIAPNSPNLPDIDPAGDPEGTRILFEELDVREFALQEPALLGRRQARALERLAAIESIPRQR